jgi:hypothetical protein
MKKWLIANFGHSYKTTIVSYLLAIGAVAQPIVESVIYDENFRFTFQFGFRLFFAVGMAVLGKYAADSAQVKSVNSDVQSLKSDVQSQQGYSHSAEEE